MDDALRALNRADAACAIAGDIAARWNTMVADNAFLDSRCNALEAKVQDLTALVLALVEGR